MNIFCKHGWHKWKYRNRTYMSTLTGYTFIQSTRYCERCEKIERAEFGDMMLMFPFFKPEYK